MQYQNYQSPILGPFVVRHCRFVGIVVLAGFLAGARSPNSGTGAGAPLGLCGDDSGCVLRCAPRSPILGLALVRHSPDGDSATVRAGNSMRLSRKEHRMSEVSTVSAEEKAQASAAEKLTAKKAEIKAAYPHANVETLRWDDVAKKYQVQITCIACGDTSRWVYTSDLFQVKMCAKCAKAARKARQKALKAQKKADKAASKPVAPTTEMPMPQESDVDADVPSDEEVAQQ